MFRNTLQACAKPIGWIILTADFPNRNAQAMSTSLLTTCSLGFNATHNTMGWSSHFAIPAIQPFPQLAYHYQNN
jgi:hypothetical protein